MHETHGDILSVSILSNACAICFTSNGVIRADNRLVMGAGVAKAFRDNFPDLDWYAACEVKRNGNKCQVIHGEWLKDYKVAIIAFPTKYHWRDPSDLVLIKQSALELKKLANLAGWKNIYLPRPGVGHGQLDWSNVKPILEEILDSRFHCITYS